MPLTTQFIVFTICYSKLAYCLTIIFFQFSWSLTQQHDRKLAAWHNRRKARLLHQMGGNRIAVAVDYSAGTITFSEVGASGSLSHLHTFTVTFSEPLCLGFGLYKAELNSRVTILTKS